MATCCTASALEIRGYNSDDINGNQKWLLHIPGQWLWGSPPYVNPAFTTFDATKLRAIGWPEHPTDWTRQIALVSPRHAVYATHYTLGADWQINFLGSDGLQHAVGIESQVPIVNSQNQPTDLMLVTLSAPVTATGITPFKVLNLANEAAYLHKPLLVCGSFVLASTSEIQGFTTLSNDPGFDTTRFIYFDYDRNATTDVLHRCNIRPGDSGGPVFVMENGEPAIVGTISSYDDLSPANGLENGPVFRNYVSSIPSYLPQLDASMDAQGYHMKRFYPAVTTLGTNVTAGAPLRQMKPGSISITTANSGAATAHNVVLSLTFPTVPTSVSGAGWICESSTPLVWTCRRGGIANAAGSSLTVSWNSLPVVGNLQLTAVQSYDGGGVITTNPSLPITQSYASWINGVADTSFNADPDRDGISNLIEYAFGGSPSQSAALTPDGRSLRPVLEKMASNLLIHYPLRTDAAARGLTETLEFSADMRSWSNTLPVGASTSLAAYSPVAAGFAEATVTLPLNGQAYFVRVRVTLAE
ncbi:MAG: hypothetical protein ABI600_05585 [Luteolibacter sp.]